MGWIITVIIIGFLCCVGFSLFVWVQRKLRLQEISRLSKCWVMNCEFVDAEDTIFVLLTCASDQPSRELLPTIDSIFRSSFCPRRVYVGIVCSLGARDKQMLLFPDGDRDREGYPHVSRFTHQVRIAGAPSNRGASLARGAGLSSLLLHERWILCAHSHSVFQENWDQRLVSEHGRIPLRVLTSRGEQGSAEFPVLLDLGQDRVPIFGSRPFARAPLSCSRVISASTRMVFGLSDELRDPAILAPPDLQGASPDLEDLSLTFQLLSRGFSIMTPSRACVTHASHVSRKARPAARERRLALTCFQARLALSFACEAVEGIMRTAAPGDMAQALSSVAAQPWCGPAFRSGALPKPIQAAFQEVERRGGGDVLTEFTNFGRRGVVSLSILKAAPRKFFAELLHILDSEDFAVGGKTWQEALARAISLYSDFFSENATRAIHTAASVQRSLGIDLRSGSATWRPFLGIPENLRLNDFDIFDRYGSREAFDLEAARWSEPSQGLNSRV